MENHGSLIQSLRDGVDIVRMIFYVEAKKMLTQKYQDNSGEFHRLLAAAMVNRLFGTPNPESPYQEFALENERLVDQELKEIPKQLPKLLIPLTDALRIHFLCNHCEGMMDLSAKVLSRAQGYGILIEDRDVPLPKGFMKLAYRIGKAYGLLNPNQEEKG